MKNTLQYYERVYTRLQDNLSDIGGIYNIVESVAYILNLLIHNYIIVLDTEDLIINKDNNNFTERNRDKRPTILQKASNYMSPPRRLFLINKKRYENIYQDEQVSSNHLRFFKNSSNIMRNIENNININNNIDIYYNNIGQEKTINNMNNNCFTQDKIKDKNFTRNNYKEITYENKYRRKGHNNENTNTNTEKKIIKINIKAIEDEFTILKIDLLKK